MIIRTNVNLSNVSLSKKVEKEETKIIENQDEEIIEQLVITKSEKKKKKSQPIIVEPDIFIEEKVEETEDEDLSRWLKEDDNII